MHDNGEAALNNIFILDLSRVLAGPYCTMVLANLGARVVKVESPAGDDARQFGPFIDGESAYFASLNQNKESIALDLKDTDDRRIFEALLGRADVLVENFRPGVMAKLGYDWERLHENHPGLIYAAVSGFGQTGPYRDRPAYDMVVQAMGGIMSITGQPGGPPVRVGTSIGDITAALFTVIGITSALYRREQTGRGEFIDVAMLDCQAAILENAIARFVATGAVPGPLGARHPSIAPFGAFDARDEPIIIAAGNDKLFAVLCDLIDRPDLADNPLFATNEQRCTHIAALSDELNDALKGRDAWEWLARLQEGGIPCGPINDVAEVLGDEHLAARDMVVDGRAGGRAMPMAGTPIKMGKSAAGRELRGAPGLDQHREALLQELGLD